MGTTNNRKERGATQMFPQTQQTLDENPAGNTKEIGCTPMVKDIAKNYFKNTQSHI